MAFLLGAAARQRNGKEAKPRRLHVNACNRTHRTWRRPTDKITTKMFFYYKPVNYYQ